MTTTQVVREKLIEAWNAEGEILSFAEFMRIALYTPGAGYYMCERSPFKEGGDFITAPLLTPLFGKTLGNAMEKWFESQPDLPLRIIELGAGTGALAASLLPHLEEKLLAQGRSLETYVILELSGARRAEQEATLKAALPSPLFERVVWWERLPETWSGIVVANEVLDAIPVHRVRWSNGEYWEVGVGYKDTAQNEAEWEERYRALDGSRPYDKELLTRAERYVPQQEGYTSEIHLEAEALVSTLGQCITKGIMLWIDYGFDAATYYHPERSQGTLRVHQRHKSHDNWWDEVGNVDITSHVNFEGIAEAALEAGWVCEGYVSQAAFLLNAGLLELLPDVAAISTEEYARQVQPVQMLISSAEMGELFKMVVLSRALSSSLWVSGEAV